MLCGHHSSVSSGAASSCCLLGRRRRLSLLLSLRGLTATTACSPARLRASWMDSSQFSMPQRGSSATGGSLTTSHCSSAMFSTGCQSHSAPSTSSVYSSFYHFTKLLQSTCAIAALGLIPLRLGYVYDHLSAEDEDALWRSCFLCRRSSVLEQSPSCYLSC